MSLSLFHRGIAARLAGALLFGAAAFGSVLALTGARPTAQASARTTPDTADLAPAVICVESIHPVGAWDVRLDGVALTARRSGPTLWLGTTRARAGATLLIEAGPTADATRGRNALRIRVAGTPIARDDTVWFERDWSAVVRVDQLAAAPAPIDPEDLP